MKSFPSCRRCVVVLLALSTASLPADEPARPGPARSHVLFMGADLSVPRNKGFHRVEGVVGSEFRIKVGQKEFFVPTRNRTTDLKVDHSLKLSGTSVTLDELHSGPAYSPANDPNRKLIAASGAAGGAAAIQDLATGQMIQTAVADAHAVRVAEANPGIEAAQIAAREMRIQLQRAEDRSGAMTHSLVHDSQNSVAAAADKRAGELAEGNYDAMEVSFRISSPVELEDPYMVVLFKFQPPGGKPGDEGLVIHAKALDPIGEKPKYVRVREAGLPVGFRFLDCVVHIYNRGLEVATNESSKRVELTRDEARQYVVMDHLGTNKGGSVPATAVPGSLPRNRLSELTLDQLNRTYYAKISPDGTLLGLYADESCNLRMDDAVTVALAGELLYRPALHRGKPVEGVARLRFGEI